MSIYKNIFKDKELEENSVVAKNATTATDGKNYIIDFYNLDMIISDIAALEADTKAVDKEIAKYCNELDIKAPIFRGL